MSVGFVNSKVRFEAMAITMPSTPTHSNKHPFSGILCRIDEPSDGAPNGSNGKQVILPKDVAETAIPTLLGMAVDMKDDFTGHDPQQKIGIITEAKIDGNALVIGGFFYAEDFPEAVAKLVELKDDMGFSYEALVRLNSMQDDPLKITFCEFTGAAVLFKDLAAYKTTALAAQAEDNEMNEELKALLESIQNRIDERFDKIEAAQSNLVTEVEAKIAAAAAQTKIEAGSVVHLVQKHSESLRACAAAMEADGMGLHPENGHVVHLTKMADAMVSNAALGKLPHSVYDGSMYFSDAGKGVDGSGLAAEDKPVVAEAVKVEAAADPVEDPAVVALKAELEAAQTKIKDLEEKKFHAAEQPSRQTSQVVSGDREVKDPKTEPLLRKLSAAGVDLTAEKLEMEVVDKALQASGANVQQRMAAKLKLREMGKI